ncbi:hypothetical protein HanIR_Chr07g0305021 [Helianthus annuus]|nr:hypothetical protein HanIR_Chr07g0305021 [Helianthus annuus]
MNSDVQIMGRQSFELCLGCGLLACRRMSSKCRLRSPSEERGTGGAAAH